MSLRKVLLSQINSVSQKFGVYVSRFPPPLSKERLLKDSLTRVGKALAPTEGTVLP